MTMPPEQRKAHQSNDEAAMDAMILQEEQKPAPAKEPGAPMEMYAALSKQK